MIISSNNSFSSGDISNYGRWIGHFMFLNESMDSSFIPTDNLIHHSPIFKEFESWHSSNSIFLCNISCNIYVNFKKHNIPELCTPSSKNR
mmetsp:Transcript_15990/g.22036  ORF Transcript_15990/g.22036 Transcript_15990/m.22036 type:complete len:90 (-) Transcript_15990:260-529(-)